MHSFASCFFLRHECAFQISVPGAGNIDVGVDQPNVVASPASCIVTRPALSTSGCVSLLDSSVSRRRVGCSCGENETVRLDVFSNFCFENIEFEIFAWKNQLNYLVFFVRVFECYMFSLFGECFFFFLLFSDL